MHARRAALPARRCEFRHPAVQQLLRAVGLDARLRRRQPGRRSSSSATSPTRARATPRAYFDAFTFFVLPHGLLAVSIATTFAPEMARVGRPPRPAGVHRPGVARRPADRAADAARRRAASSCCAGRSSARCCSTASTPRPTPTTRRGRSAASPSGSSGSPCTCSCCAASTPTRTRARRSSSTSCENVLNIVLAFVLVGRYGVLGLGLALAISYVVCVAVGAAGAVVQGARASRCATILASLWRMVARRGARRRGDVARRVAASAATPDRPALLRLVVGGDRRRRRLRRRARRPCGRPS